MVMTYVVQYSGHMLHVCWYFWYVWFETRVAGVHHVPRLREAITFFGPPDAVASKTMQYCDQLWSDSFWALGTPAVFFGGVLGIPNVAQGFETSRFTNISHNLEDPMCCAIKFIIRTSQRVETPQKIKSIFDISKKLLLNTSMSPPAILQITWLRQIPQCHRLGTWSGAAPQFRGLLGFICVEHHFLNGFLVFIIIIFLIKPVMFWMIILNYASKQRT